MHKQAESYGDLRCPCVSWLRATGLTATKRSAGGCPAITGYVCQLCACSHRAWLSEPAAARIGRRCLNIKGEGHWFNDLVMMMMLGCCTAAVGDCGCCCFTLMMMAAMVMMMGMGVMLVMLMMVAAPVAAAVMMMVAMMVLLTTMSMSQMMRRRRL